MKFLKKLLLEFGGERGATKKDTGKETSIIRMVLKNNDVSPQKITRRKDGKESNRTAYSDKTKAGHSFKIYLGGMPKADVQKKIKSEITKAIPGADVSFGPKRGGSNYDNSPFIRVKVAGTHK